MAGRHAAPSSAPRTGSFTLPIPRVPDPATATGASTTGTLTRAGIAAALVTASAAAVAGPTGALAAPSTDLSPVRADATLLSAHTPNAAGVASSVAPVTSGVSTAPAQSVKHSSPVAEKAAADQAAAAQAEQQQQEDAAAAKKKESAESESSGSSSGVSSLGALGDRLVDAASEYKGTPYEWGATGPDSFDCSGFTQHVFSEMGIDLPRTSQQQYDAAEHLSRSQAQPGDLIFVGGENSIHHVAIYAGDGKMWTAPQTGESVKLGNVYGNWHVGRIR